MQVDLKVLKPFGAILLLVCAVLVIIMALTADMGVPERYESRHDYEYYSQNAVTMGELLSELEENVFPRLDGILGSDITGDNLIRIRVDGDNFDKVAAVIKRDFDERLFLFALAE
jgi:hypothetical protein